MSTIGTRITVSQLLSAGTGRFSSAVRHEILRKCIHLLVAFVPALAAVDLPLTMALLTGGTLFYVLAEHARMRGIRVPIISRVTILASRERDQGHFVLSPVTLGVGAMLALTLYPSPASAIAIYALAFGDGLASLAGGLVGSIRIPLTGGKTLQGSLTCLLAVFAATYLVTGKLGASAAIAAAAAFLELLPTGDFDNMVLPVGTGFVAMLILPLAAVPLV